MKDLLFVTSSYNRPLYVEAGRRLSKATQGLGEEMKQLLDTTWLLTGPKSFEIVICLCNIAAEYDLPVAVFEAEGILACPPEPDSLNTAAPLE